MTSLQKCRTVTTNNYDSQKFVQRQALLTRKLSLDLTLDRTFINN